MIGRHRVVLGDVAQDIQDVGRRHRASKDVGHGGRTGCPARSPRTGFGLHSRAVTPPPARPSRISYRCSSRLAARSRFGSSINRRISRTSRTDIRCRKASAPGRRRRAEVRRQDRSHGDARAWPAWHSAQPFHGFALVGRCRDGRRRGVRPLVRDRCVGPPADGCNHDNTRAAAGARACLGQVPRHRRPEPDAASATPSPALHAALAAVPRSHPHASARIRHIDASGRQRIGVKARIVQLDTATGH